MAKKKATRGKKEFDMENALDFLVSNDSVKKEEQTTQASPKPRKAKKKYTTVTVRIEEDLFLKVKAVAYWKRRKIMDVFNTSLLEHIENMNEEDLEKAVEDYQKYTNE